MALGTATLADTAQRDPLLNPYMFVLSFTGDTSYPTGGTTGFQAYVRSAVGLLNLTVVAVVPVECGGYLPQWDAVAGTLKVYHGNNDGGADGPLVEVPNTTALNGTTFKVLVIGK
jgi:hypothetical protein